MNMVFNLFCKIKEAIMNKSNLRCVKIVVAILSLLCMVTPIYADSSHKYHYLLVLWGWDLGIRKQCAIMKWGV